MIVEHGIALSQKVAEANEDAIRSAVHEISLVDCRKVRSERDSAGGSHCIVTERFDFVRRRFFQPGQDRHEELSVWVRRYVFALRAIAREETTMLVKHRSELGCLPNPSSMLRGLRERKSE